MAETGTTPKVVVVMPAYNAGRTLRMTYEELPKDTVNLVILVDDGSTDATPDVARQLGLEIFVHNRNYAYGANQQTCYADALRAGAEVVRGSRVKRGSALGRGMPWWEYGGNRLLTGLENWVFGLRLSEYHTGYGACRRAVLETVNIGANSDGFVFDQEIVAQVVA